MLIGVFTGGIICAMDTVSHIHLVEAHLCSSKMINFELYIIISVLLW